MDLAVIVEKFANEGFVDKISFSESENQAYNFETQNSF